MTPVHLVLAEPLIPLPNVQDRGKPIKTAKERPYPKTTWVPFKGRDELHRDIFVHTHPPLDEGNLTNKVQDAFLRYPHETYLTNLFA